MNNHYVYQITFKSGMKYIGVRSCKCNIEEDNYHGSSKYLPNEIGCKEILSTHESRQNAMNEEIRLHALYNVKDNNLFYNQCNSISTKFQPSKEAHQRSAKARTGRTKETHEYIAKQVQARAKYKGNGLTPAQKAQWSPKRKEERIKKYKETLAETMKDPIKAAKIQEARIKGGKSGKGIPNPKKAHYGIDHPRVQSWWYKDPKGNITIVNDSIRNYCKENSIFPMTAASIMRYIRENKVPEKVLKQGWNFGLNNGQEVTNPVE